MCDGCRTKMKARYEGRKMILEREPCNCERCDTVEFDDVPRCVNCGHKLDVKLTDDASFWERNPPWTDENGNMLTRTLEKLED